MLAITVQFKMQSICLKLLSILPKSKKKINPILAKWSMAPLITTNN